MKGLVIFSFVLAALALPLETLGKKNVVCYFTSWTSYRNGNGKFDVSNIDPSLCTHINYAFVGLDPAGKIKILDDWEAEGDYGPKALEHLVALKKNNTDLKVLVSMGGWTEGSSTYSKVAADPAKRKSLAADVLQFIEKWGFDGFDLDWEYPGQRDSSNPEDVDNFVKLLLELKTFLSPKYLLTAAVAGGVYTARVAYHVPLVSQILDMLNVMTYDYHGHFEPYVGHVSPLYKSSLDVGDENLTLNVAAGIEYWLDSGADPAKINLGIVTYGRSFTLADPNNTRLYAPTTGGGKMAPYTQQEGILGYNELCELHSDWTYYFDDEQKVPHRISGNQWVGYEDTTSLKYKAEYAKSKNLGGMMVWAFDTDDFRGLCGETYPLLRAINKNLA